ncbi:MAG: sulfite exporter TauE/SafE family protein [Acidobacteriia bacterium]|nr:sulfite exporter TauE/SafE family protein [Terriglobia bacterium]
MPGEYLALLLALLIGLSLGALGSGGSIVTLPILVYVAGIEPKAAVGMSMAIVGGTSLLGGYFHWRSGNFLLKPALLFSATGIVGAYLGSGGTHLVSSSVLLLLFSGLMLVVAARMLGGAQVLRSSDVTCSTYRCIASGFAVGLVTGFLGVGGGFLIVPALVWFAGLDAKRAIGTSLGIIAANSAAGLAGQLRYTHWDWPLTGTFLACSLIGMGLGIPIARRAPERALRKAFAIVVLAVAVAIGWQVLGHR